jgi:pimeloyl-ACP methyl ester carboxylesterase
MVLTLHAQAARAFDPTPYLHAQRLVNVDGRRVNLYCTGSGSPTVVLGTDGDDGTSAWRFVQPVVARHTRVCSYDPPGFGFSDPLAAGLDASKAVADLHTLLSRGGASGPIVLVGYSLSGLYARLFADRYPRDVAGMVLVSPDLPDQDRMIASVVPALAPMLDIHSFLQQCLVAAQRGAIRPGTPTYAQCVYSPPDPSIPKKLLDFVHRQWQGAGLWSSFASTMSEEGRSSAEIVRDQRQYGGMPLIVLTTTTDIGALPISTRQKAALTDAWVAWQQNVARLSSIGVDFLIQDSTQAIPIDRPAEVISAIDEIVSQVRYRSK